MLFPFRTSAIFRNRWIALLWAVGICFMASEIVDSVSGVTDKKGSTHSAPARDVADAGARSHDQVAAILDNPPPEDVAR